MKVSIVCANHGRDVTKLIESVHASTYKAHDIHIIDVGMERSAQRNIGIKRAKGDCILILDSDQSVSKYLIAECVDLIKQGYTCVYIPEVIIATGFFGKIRKFERTFYTGTHIDVPRFIDASYCPMFDETMSGPEDADWGRRIDGLRAVSKNVLYHNDNISFKEYCKKKAYYSKSMKQYALKNPDDPTLNIFYRCFWVFVENGKWKRLFKHPILSIGIFFVLAIRGIIYYVNK